MNNYIQTTLFDYNQLDPETRIVVQQRTSEIKALMKRTAQDIIEIGEKLIDVKERLGHGNFGGWLEVEFGWSWSSANKYMQVAEQFKFVNFTNLDVAPSALQLLAAPSTPDEVREEAIARAQDGETITHSTAKEIVNNHKLGIEWLNNPATWHRSDSYNISPTQTLENTVIPPVPESDTQSFDYKRDNRRAQVSDIYTPLGMDACQTPPYAIDPLLVYLQEGWNIWEPARGEGFLEGALFDSGFSVVSGDILTSQNFFDYEPDNWDCIVTNPPYSIQFQWLERCYQLGKPFALLLKVEILGTKTAQELMKKYGFEILLLDKRVDFKMPYKGWDSSAQFPTFWLCWQLLPEKVIFGTINKETVLQEATL